MLSRAGPLGQHSPEPRPIGGRRDRRGWAARMPWIGPGGRFSLLKTIVLALVASPAAIAGIAWGNGQLGARPTDALLHMAGLWTLRLLLLALAVRPVGVVLAWPRLISCRRIIGVAALAYGILHLGLYAAQQDWRLSHVGGEILHRYYLSIGFLALCGLLALGVTSTDGWMRRLGRGWQRLHRLAYPVAALALCHFFLQARRDVAPAVLDSVLLAWLMLWRMLPQRARRDGAALVGISLAAAAVGAAAEYTWFALATRIDPLRVLRVEANLHAGPHALLRGLIIGLATSGLAVLRQGSHGTGRDRRMPVPRAATLAAVGLLFAPAAYWLTRLVIAVL